MRKFFSAFILAAALVSLDFAAVSALTPDNNEPSPAKPVDAGYNVYGHPIQFSGSGYIVKDEQRIRERGVFDFDKAPEGMLRPYKVSYKTLTDSDFSGAVTSTCTFKKYPDYDLKLEVDMPKEGKGPFPYIIWIHGGGWHGGDMYGHKPMSAFLASHGIAGIRISYSLSSKGVKFADSWTDIQDAVKYIRDHAGEWNLDNANFGFAGHSAGGHLSSYAAMRTPGTKVLFAFNGVYDIANVSPRFVPDKSLEAYFGTSTADKEFASPCKFVHRGAPFVFLTYSSGDWLVDPQQVRIFEKALKVNGVPCEIWERNYYSHSGFIGGTDIYEETLMKILELSDKYLK